MGPDEMNPQVPREMADEVAKPLSAVFEKSWQFCEAPTDWKRGNITSILKKSKKKDLGNYRPVSLISVHGKVEQSLLETVLRRIENKEVIGDSQHGFTNGKSCLTNFLAFYDGVTALVDKGRATDGTCLDLSKVFDTHMKTLSLNWRDMDLMDRPLGGKGIGWLGGHTQSVAVNSLISKWKSMISGIP